MKNVDFLNDLAIRASYGIQGNVHPDQTPNLIASLGTLESMPQEYISTLYKLPNNKLKWEKTNSYQCNGMLETLGGDLCTESGLCHS